MRRLLAALMLAIPLLLATVPVAAAPYDPFGGVCGTTSTGSSAVCSNKATGNPISGPNGVIVKVVDIVALVAGAASIIVLFIASLKYLTSQGDSASVSSAKQTIIYALIGIVVIVLARSLIVFVVSRIT